MLSAAIADLLPMAVGVALSPVPIIAVILMLGTPKARSNGPAFACGWMLGLVVVSVLVLIGSLTVAGPVLYYMVASDTAAPRLASIKEFMTAHNAVIMMVVLLILGAKLLGAGVAGLMG